MKSFVIAVVLLTCGAAPWLTGRAAAQAVDSTCLALWQYCSQYNVGVPYGISVDSAAKLNPDSLRIDTCEGSLTYRRDYAKRTFEVVFQYYLFPDSGYAVDTIVTHQWQDIDSTFPEIRKQMELIEQRFGQFTLWRRFWDSVYLDTSSFILKGWYFNFDQYVNVDSAVKYIDSLPDIEVDFGNAQVFFYAGLRLDASDNRVNDDLPNDKQRVVVWPQPCTTEVILQGSENITTPEIMDMLGRHLQLPTRFLSDSTLSIDLTSVPSGILFLKFPQQVIKIIVRK